MIITLENFGIFKRRISFNLVGTQGNITLLSGPSGCGKSTILEALQFITTRSKTRGPHPKKGTRCTARVSLELDVRGIPTIITRTNGPSTMKVVHGDILLEGDEAFSFVSTHVSDFQAYIAQKGSSTFIEMTPMRRVEYIEEISGSHDASSLVEKIRVGKKQSFREKTEIEKDLEIAEERRRHATETMETIVATAGFPDSDVYFTQPNAVDARRRLASNLTSAMLNRDEIEKHRKDVEEFIELKESLREFEFEKRQYSSHLKSVRSKLETILEGSTIDELKDLLDHMKYHNFQSIFGKDVVSLSRRGREEMLAKFREMERNAEVSTTLAKKLRRSWEKLDEMNGEDTDFGAQLDRIEKESSALHSNLADLNEEVRRRARIIDETLKECNEHRNLIPKLEEKVETAEAAKKYDEARLSYLEALVNDHELSRKSLECPCCGSKLLYDAVEKKLVKLRTSPPEIDIRQTKVEVNALRLAKSYADKFRRKHGIPVGDIDLDAVRKEIDALRLSVDRVNALMADQATLNVLRRKLGKMKIGVRAESADGEEGTEFAESTLDELVVAVDDVTESVERNCANKTRVVALKEKYTSLRDEISRLEDRLHNLGGWSEEDMDRTKRLVDGIKRLEKDKSVVSFIDTHRHKIVLGDKIRGGSGFDQIKHLESRISDATMYTDEILRLESDIAAIVSNISECTRELETRAVLVRGRWGDEDVHKILDQCSDDIERETRRIHDLKKREVAESIDKYFAARDARDSYTSRIYDLDEKKTAVGLRIDDLEELECLVKDVRTEMLVQFVKSIESHLNVYVSSFFEESMSVKFDLVENKTGAKELSMKILYRDVEYDTPKVLSGGEYDRLNVAMVLALSEVGKTRWIVFDETLSSLDLKTFDNVLEGMRELVPRSKNIIIVAHQAVTGSFDNIISLE